MLCIVKPVQVRRVKWVKFVSAHGYEEDGDDKEDTKGSYGKAGGVCDQGRRRCACSVSSLNGSCLFESAVVIARNETLSRCGQPLKSRIRANGPARVAILRSREGESWIEFIYKASALSMQNGVT